MSCEFYIEEKLLGQLARLQVACGKTLAKFLDSGCQYNYILDLEQKAQHLNPLNAIYTTMNRRLKELEDKFTDAKKEAQGVQVQLTNF